ncbi:SCP2 sterol-binding domain-containing protein [Catellatospora sp. NPDC049609]|uniref:SCP2 sterol-binding domain-containing protein n=1 Tax=Catellatospora sp. NPDC049609 TaxID=3155505 RepID=UPI0034340BCD
MTADPATDYFTGLAEHGRYPLLGAVTGTIRFDLGNHGRTEHWRVAIARGHVDVSRGGEPADCIVKVDKKLFDGMVTGTVNTMAAVLRGQVDVDGDLHLITMLQRLFPGRPPLPEHTGRRHTK